MRKSCFLSGHPTLKDQEISCLLTEIITSDALSPFLVTSSLSLQLLTAMVQKMGDKDDDPLPQATMDGCDSDEWSD